MYPCQSLLTVDTLLILCSFVTFATQPRPRQANQDKQAWNIRSTSRFVAGNSNTPDLCLNYLKLLSPSNKVLNEAMAAFSAMQVAQRKLWLHLAFVRRGFAAVGQKFPEVEVDMGYPPLKACTSD